MIVGGEKPSLDELVHHGVKGMKWGIRKDNDDKPIHPSYTPQMQKDDRQQHGNRAVGRINKHLNEGGTRDEALQREEVRNARQRLAVAGGLVLAGLLTDHGSVSAGSLKSYVGNRAKTNREAAKIISIGVSAAKTNFVKPRRGVYDITTMR